MKYRRLLLFLGLLFLCLVPAISLSAGISIPILKAGDTLTVTDVTPIDNTSCWYTVSYPDGTIGYIRSDDIVSELTENESVYIGNVKSMVFHRPTCRNLPSEKNTATLNSREEAIAQGYQPCGNCEP